LSVLEDTEIKALKSGMLFNSPIVRVVADTLRGHFTSSALPAFVVDPVCVSTSGHTLLDDNAIDVLDSELAPLATLITPNRAEAEALLHHRGTPHKIETVDDMIEAAIKLVQKGCSAVLLKGGHVVARAKDVQLALDGHRVARVFREGGMRTENMEILATVESKLDDQTYVVDVLARRDEDVSLFVRPKIDSSSTHGTGCTLSAAIASYLALGHDCMSKCTEK
jgi:hydroxymethylpyrimidine/phosphomethylpyrimidine kinase